MNACAESAPIKRIRNTRLRLLRYRKLRLEFFIASVTYACGGPLMIPFTSRPHCDLDTPSHAAADTSRFRTRFKNSGTFIFGVSFRPFSIAFTTLLIRAMRTVLVAPEV